MASHATTINAFPAFEGAHLPEPAGRHRQPRHDAAGADIVEYPAPQHATLSLARSLRLAATGPAIDAALSRWQCQALRHGRQMSGWGIALGERIMALPRQGASEGQPREGMF
ncbi:hypothetical protein ASR47_1001212 [Janthinobacterium psychrotolerans]|uniref:Uncharacterized protein n=1 Tax=Janthinobacterium psychrotolerans TaxID=1747903 RepID=A0A1A7BVE9_9BURK|nr:hypothetical protein ASR47_1001212 [Janthinobacterium psychrotolerans]